MRTGLAGSIFALSWVQLANYLFPLIIIPYLARVLGPETWGVVAFAFAVGQYVNLTVEYGFEFSATRSVVRARESFDQRAALLTETVGAKLLLGSGAVLIIYPLSFLLPIVQDRPRVLWSGVAWGVASALNFVWYFQGLERMRLVAVLEVGTKALALVGIFSVVHSSADAWLVLMTLAAASLLSAITALVLAWQEVPIRCPRWSGIVAGLRGGWALFVFKASVGLYTAANVLILGLFAAPSVVGFYAAGERIVKAVLGLLTPVSRSMFPRMSALVAESNARAREFVRRGAIGVVGVGGVIAFGLIVGAPIVVRLLLGPGYESVVAIIRILAFLLPIIGLSNILGIQWMVPLGLDRPFIRVIVAAGVMNVGLAFVLAPRFGDIGMAAAVLTTESFVTVGLWLYLRRHALDPLRPQPDST